MNTIIQKRIEAESNKYMEEAIEMNGVVGDNLHYKDLKTCFIEAADFALQNQWISVEEALPEVNELVFGFVNDEGTSQAVGVAYYDEYGGWHYSDEEEISLITHWMPIPSLGGGDK